MMTAGAMALALLLAPEGVVAQDPLAVAETVAAANAASDEGKVFAESVGQAFGRGHGVTIGQCAKAAKRSDISNFDVFLRLDAAGVVDQALVDPVTTLSSCVKDKMPGWKAPAPTASGYWVKIAVNLKGKS